MVEELLSHSGALGKETAKGIADAAMLEVASISVGQMVMKWFSDNTMLSLLYPLHTLTHKFLF